MPSDPFLTQQLRALQHLAAQHPGTPTSRAAYVLIRRTRYYLRHGMSDGAPRTRRYLLADLRAAALRLEALEPKETP